MGSLLKGVFVVGAKRTPIGTLGGLLSKKSVVDLGEISSQSALESSKIPPERVDSIIVGHVVTSASVDAVYSPRHIGLRIGVDVSKPSYMVNRLCGSGLQAIVSGAQEIVLTDSNVVLACGTESMSMIPYVVRGIRFGTKLGKGLDTEDLLWGTLIDSHCKMIMGQTADKLAKQFNISRENSDKYAFRSQILWKEAQDDGAFNAEICPIIIQTKKGPAEMRQDEFPKPNTNLETLSKLRPTFTPDGVVTPGNAAGMSDGAASVVLASEDFCRESNLKPLMRVVGYAVAGVDPTIMGIGASRAIQKLLQISKVSLDQVGMVEINEAFAPQVLACQEELNLSNDVLNIHGGAIAMGHPVGASGTRLAAHIAHHMKKSTKQYSIASTCIGGGQGIAVLFEKS